MLIKRGFAWIAATAALAACGDEGLGGPEFPDVSGQYVVRFEATEATGCKGFVETGFTDGFLQVTQQDEDVTLELTEVTEFILTDPEGRIDSDGHFLFDGTIAIGDGESSTTADGAIDGFFNLVAGTIDLAFDFTAFTCQVRGRITGQRGGGI